MLPEVTGLKSKAVGAGMWAVTFWVLGWFNMSSVIGTDDMSWAAFTKNSFRILATEIWFDMILSFSEGIIIRFLEALCLTKMVLRWTRSV